MRQFSVWQKLGILEDDLKMENDLNIEDDLKNENNSMKKRNKKVKSTVSFWTMEGKLTKQIMNDIFKIHKNKLMGIFWAGHG